LCHLPELLRLPQRRRYARGELGIGGGLKRLQHRNGLIRLPVCQKRRWGEEGDRQRDNAQPKEGAAERSKARLMWRLLRSVAAILTPDVYVNSCPDPV